MLALAEREGELRAGRPVDVGTGSGYSIMMSGPAGRRTRARGWRNSRRKPCANPDLIHLALEWRDRYGHRFRFTHIYAHTGGSDERSVKNHKADRLAVAGANKYGQVQGVIPVRPPPARTPTSSPTRPPPAPHLVGSPLPSPSTD